jgi:hypothetical protein
MTARSQSQAVIRRPVLPASDAIGTANPIAFKQPIFKKKTVQQSYAEMAALSAELDAAKAEYDRAKAEFDNHMAGPQLTPFFQFKKWILDFSTRMNDRERELSVFSQFLDSYRKTANPTFVEVDAARYRRPRFDAVTVSLLVSNPERAFFGKEDLQQQNEELQRLIDQQGQALNLLGARLRLFTKSQHSTAGESVSVCLKNGQMPRLLGGTAPTRALELKTKAKMLSAQLALLVATRRQIVKEKVKKKMKLRKHRLKVKLSIKIQKVMRGFLARLAMKKMRAAAVMIQKVWRGYLVRYRGRQGMDDMEQSVDSDSPRPSRKMRKIIKTRTNPDGEEQEYYDYQYDDEVGPETTPDVQSEADVTEITDVVEPE